MAFEIYIPRKFQKPEKEAIISISKTSLVFNLISREKLNSPRVEIAYDRDENILKIKPVDEGGMEIKKTKIFFKGISNYFGITKHGKFTCWFDSEQNALFAKIS